MKYVYQQVILSYMDVCFQLTGAYHVAKALEAGRANTEERPHEIQTLCVSDAIVQPSSAFIDICIGEEQGIGRYN